MAKKRKTTKHSPAAPPDTGRANDEGTGKPSLRDVEHRFGWNIRPAEKFNRAYGASIANELVSSIIGRLKGST